MKTVTVLIGYGLICVLSLSALPASGLTLPVPRHPAETSAIPVKGLLCGGGWHYSFAYFKCVRNRHRCAAGTHWISLLKTCVSL